MASRIDDLQARLAHLEHELEQELNHTREYWRYRIEAGRIRFERDAILAHRRLRQGILEFLAESQLLTILTAPLIYSLVLPVALLDLWVSVYQWACFPIYRIPRVRRSDFVVIDRHHLAYLNGIEKLNCAYCGYVNGVFAYVREVAGRTEQYWCPIRHARRVAAPHGRYRGFVAYGDAEGYRKRLPMLREELGRANDEATRGRES